MNTPKPFASLSPTLLARKGGARPAMRPQLAPLTHYNDSTARQYEDLGWNDMGTEPAETPAAEPVVEPVAAAPAVPVHEAEIVPLNGGASAEGRFAPVTVSPVPQVLRQREAAAADIASDRPRRSALAEGRRAAFTLRLDAQRHLQLRLACTLTNRSAQQVVTEALDKFLAEMPDVAALAEQVAARK